MTTTGAAARVEACRTDGVFLYWLPLGAGGHSVRLNGRVFEAVAARLERRRAVRPLSLGARARLAEGRFVIEMTPIPRSGGAPSRGAVAEGPVGSSLLRRLRLFRYEIRCWRDGAIPDVAEAVDSPRLLTADPAVARLVLQLVPAVPTPTWGRDELATGSMWNSNSLTSWLLACAGLEPELIRPPAGGTRAGLGGRRRRRPQARAAGSGGRSPSSPTITIGGDDVRQDQRPVAERDPVGEPEQEADEEDAHVADRDTVRGAVLDDLPDLEDGGDGHRDTPRRRCKREGGDHGATVPKMLRWPVRPERS